MSSTVASSPSRTRAYTITGKNQAVNSKHVGGALDYQRLAEMHRPTDSTMLSREVKALATQGLSDRDIGQCLRLDLGAVHQLLNHSELSQ